MAKQAHNQSIRARWTSAWIFFLAAIGSSIGLGNVWKFPYELGLHGGGTFLAVYLPCLVLVGLPLVMSELMLGKYGRMNPVHGILRITRHERLSSFWQIIGWLSIITGFLVFAFYSNVGSWVFVFLLKSASGDFVNVPAEIVQHSFNALVQDTDRLLIWHSIFVVAVIMVLNRGLNSGLERALMLLMACFVGLLVWLCYVANQIGDFDAAIAFLTHIDLSKINGKLFVSALTQVFFSLSIGIGAMMVYGSYLTDRRPIAITSVIIVMFDTAVALLMCLLIFSITFAFEMNPDVGMGLIFKTLPVVFSQMPENSVIWSSVFFLLMAVVALIAAFSLLEPAIAWMMRYFGISRRVAAWLVGIAAWFAGLPSLFSFSDSSFSFYYFGEEHLHSYFDLYNILATHILMPITALMITIFAAWRIKRKRSQAAMSVGIEMGYRLWRFSSKVIAPFFIVICLLIVMLNPA